MTNKLVLNPCLWNIFVLFKLFLGSYEEDDEQLIGSHLLAEPLPGLFTE